MTPPILLVGEAQGQSEASFGAGFVGGSGAELLRMLREARILTFSDADRSNLNLYYRTQNPKYTAAIWDRHTATVRRTNVFQLHPPRNNLAWFCGPTTAALPGYPQLLSSKWVRAEFEPELDRLAGETLELNPNLIVCLGNAALWAFTGRTRITKWRGATTLSTHCVAGYKLLPTLHPASVLYQYSQRPTVVADLHKARREAAFPELRRPAREIWIEPTAEDVEQFLSSFCRRCKVLSVDIETTGDRITCIGFAPNPELAIVIPFDDDRAKDGNYWPTRELEGRVWRAIGGVLADPGIPKLFQNGLYDIAFLWRSMRIQVLGAAHDTMLLMHSLQPEAKKSLGYLGSIYSDECAWKNLGAHSKTIKREDG